MPAGILRRATYGPTLVLPVTDRDLRTGLEVRGLNPPI